ncbi:membrane-associated protein, putative [Bodo saltans]|uniref:Membrane-associated protein, putative n=1 Tax=Bodo saltans TaxID=75058 RepID=A0A0S4J2S2_BODSA|nr:membrane-associated protein, putative [Bodo saltans]|eukprot:CUG60749.1 membrane-associated protein, putative [Bodo saltans]
MSPRSSSLTTQLLAAINIALLVCLISGGMRAYQDLAPRILKVQQFMPTASSHSGGAHKLSPAAAALLRDTLQQVSSSFLFGAVNGSLPEFLGDMLRPQVYAQLANAAVPFAASVLQAFNYTPANVCQNIETITCEQYNVQMYCNQTGKYVWCNYPGQVISCATKTCLSKYVYSVASMVEGVGALIRELQGPSQSSNSNAAFNSGELNIEALAGWLESQTNLGDWRNAGTRCLNLVEQVRSVDWVGTYTDFNGNGRNFNVTKNVGDVTDYIGQVCGNLVDLVDKVGAKRH